MYFWWIILIRFPVFLKENVENTHYFSQFVDFIYGDKTVTYFTLQDFDGESDGTEEFFNPKQKVYSEYIEDAVKDLLSSNEIDESLWNCPIEIVDVCFDNSRFL